MIVMRLTRVCGNKREVTEIKNNSVKERKHEDLRMVIDASQPGPFRLYLGKDTEAEKSVKRRRAMYLFCFTR